MCLELQGQTGRVVEEAADGDGGNPQETGNEQKSSHSHRISTDIGVGDSGRRRGVQRSSLSEACVMTSGANEKMLMHVHRR